MRFLFLATVLLLLPFAGKAASFWDDLTADFPCRLC
jgi:hypothetical protein